MKAVVVGLVTLLAAACGSSKPTQRTPTGAAKPAPAARDLMTECLAWRDWLASCQPEYAPVIVDSRVELDYPAGIAARGATPEGRTALYAEALKELPDYLSPAANQQQCDEAVKAPPANTAALLDAIHACMKQTGCAAQMACYRPVSTQIMTFRKQSGR